MIIYVLVSINHLVAILQKATKGYIVIQWTCFSFVIEEHRLEFDFAVTFFPESRPSLASASKQAHIAPKGAFVVSISFRSRPFLPLLSVPWDDEKEKLFLCSLSLSLNVKANCALRFRRTHA